MLIGTSETPGSTMLLSWVEVRTSVAVSYDPYRRCVCRVEEASRAHA